MKTQPLTTSGTAIRRKSRLPLLPPRLGPGTGPGTGPVPGMRPAAKTRSRRRYTYADYVSWDDDIRREIIDGEVYMMAAPTSGHQAIITAFVNILGAYLKGKPCRVYAAPFDVRLYAPWGEAAEGKEDDKRDRFVLQPDISVICDRRKVFKEGAHGAPDFIIEIISESSRSHDLVRKSEAYMKAGVREYWALDIIDKVLYVFTHDAENGLSVADPVIYQNAEKVKVGIFPDLEIDLEPLYVTGETGW